MQRIEGIPDRPFANQFGSNLRESVGMRKRRHALRPSKKLALAFFFRKGFGAFGAAGLVVRNQSAALTLQSLGDLPGPLNHSRKFILFCNLVVPVID